MYSGVSVSGILIFSQGEIAMFGVNETYQRALLQWQRAAAQGKRFDFEITAIIIESNFIFIFFIF